MDGQAHPEQEHHALGSDSPVAGMMGMMGMTEQELRRRFWVALALTVPLVLLSGTIPAVRVPVSPKAANWIGLVLATPIVWWCGWVFLSGAVMAIRGRSLDMSVLISTGGLR